MNRYSKYFLQNALWLDDGFCEYYLQDESWGRLEILDVESVIFNWPEEALQWLNQCTAYDEFSTLRQLRVFLSDHCQEYFPLHTMNDRQVLQAAARHISQSALQLVIKPEFGWAVQVDEQTAEPVQPLRTEPEPDLGSLLDQVRTELDALVVEQQQLYHKHEAAMAGMSEAEKAQYYSKHAGGAVYDSAIGETIGLVASAAKAAPGFFKGYLKTLWKVAQAPSKMAQLTVQAIAQGDMNPIKDEIDKIVDPVAKGVDQALEYKSMITILLSEPLTQHMLQDFAGRYWDATHPIERTKMGASAVTDVVVTVILAIVTVGVGAAANVAAKSARLVKVAKLLKKIAAVIKRINPDSKLLNTRKSAGKSSAPKTKKTGKAGTSTKKGVSRVEKPKAVDETGGKGYKADSDSVVPKTTTAEPTTTVFRVQGGTPPKASKRLIEIGDDGNPLINKSTLNVSMGDMEHAKHFQKARPGSEVVSFEVPKWMDDFVQEEAIPQLNYKKNPLNQGGLAPKVVDPTTPGRSYELPSIWSEWLEETAIKGSGKVIK